MFRGRHPHTIDGKGRLAIPARFRDVLAQRDVDTLVLAEGDQCVWAFPLDEWERFEQRIQQQSQIAPEMRQLLRGVVSSAKDCPVDRAGRTLVPPDLREFAGLHKDVIVVGALVRFEIWNRDRWAVHLETLRGGFDDMTRTLGKLGL